MASSGLSTCLVGIVKDARPVRVYTADELEISDAGLRPLRRLSRTQATPIAQGRNSTY